jgi:hypothetical protein
VFIVARIPQGHPLVRYAHLVEYRSLGVEAEPRIEGGCGCLGMKIDGPEPEFCGVVHEVENECGTEAPAAVVRQDRDPADLAASFESSGADRFTVRIDGDHVVGEGVGRIPLLGLGDVLLFDEDAAPHPFGPGALGVPADRGDPVSVGQRDRPHGAPQMPRARRAAAPM